ncbi:IQ domain-containing protein M [Hemicordylus capensis]|uniref:IQ domain-containing protein M n=1 Tax=Hemicordylus capensis TaxID=884348 RepID=UPI002303387E|nr:IQ domain-containing protein M [Hemicordylus capensis]
MAGLLAVICESCEETEQDVSPCCSMSSSTEGDLGSAENTGAHHSLMEIPREPRRVCTSAPPILGTDVDIKHKESTQAAKALNTSVSISSKETLDKLPLRPCSDTFLFTMTVKTCPEKMSSNGSKSQWCGKKKDKIIWLSDVYTRVGSLSKTMEQKNTMKPSISRNNLLGISTSKREGTVWLPKNEHGKAYQDWRGVILSENTVPYTMLSNEEHQERLIRITRRQRSKGMLLSNIKLERRSQESKKHGRRLPRKRAVGSITEQVKRIGPHLEIFEAFKEIRRVPNLQKTIAAATCIQKIIRGWLSRTRWNRIKRKAKSHGPTLLAVVKEYRRMMDRIKRRCGIVDRTTPLIVEELEDWLDKKKLYETMFAKREFWKEMDKNELPKFFRDCGRFPSTEELNTTMNLVLAGSNTKIVSIKKNQAVEMAFMLYPPLGLKLKTAATTRSTWIKPIVDGEDSYKYLMSGHPIFKKADLRIAARVVAASMKERKMKERQADPLETLEDFD